MPSTQLLRPLTEADVTVVERLWQLYSHDMSEARGTLPNAEGLYKPGRLAAYLDSPDDVDGYLIQRHAAPAGFAFVCGLSGELLTMGDFFVVRAARRQGVGNDVVKELFTATAAAGRSGSRRQTVGRRTSGGAWSPTRSEPTGRRSGGPCPTSPTSRTTTSFCSRSPGAPCARPRRRRAAALSSGDGSGGSDRGDRSWRSAPLVFRHSADIYDAVYSFKDYAAESERIHALVEERTPGASTLLDVACGTGKHLQHLRAWYDVSGLDLDPQLLDIARERLGDVDLHAGDMTAFALGRRFDVVTCLFSSIGYAGTVERVGNAIAAMAAHLNPGGVLIVEPWLTPDAWLVDKPHLLSVDEPDLKIARMTISGREGGRAIMSFEYLVGTPTGIDAFSERHEMVLVTDEEYRRAFVAAGLAVEHDPDGLIGRGLYIAQAAG